jgi:hypothetical protein
MFETLLLHHDHVAVFVQSEAIDLLPRMKCSADRFVHARTFVEIGRRLLALRNIEMQLGLQFVLKTRATAKRCDTQTTRSSPPTPSKPPILLTAC